MFKVILLSDFVTKLHFRLSTYRYSSISIPNIISIVFYTNKNNILIRIRYILISPKFVNNINTDKNILKVKLMCFIKEFQYTRVIIIY